jgi:threonine dehydratase
LASKLLPELADIQRARAEIRAFSLLTPVFTSSFFSDLCGCDLYFKCENFQKIGAFKFRGAMNALLNLAPGIRARGVITHSSGNHGQAVSLAARNLGVKATVVMPDNSVPVKVDAIRGYGAEVVFCKPGGREREDTTAHLMEQSGATLIHPYDDFAVIAGQGTAFLEFDEQVSGLEVLLTPVGGGGLLSGCSIAARGLYGGRIRIHGAEPAGADDAARSLAAGKIIANERIETVADGLRTTSLGERTFAALSANVDGIFTVSDADTLRAMRMVWERMKIIIEPSSAVPLAALLNHKRDFAGRKVGIVLSGGNVNFEDLVGRQ